MRMTSSEHRIEASLAILADATGPLTPHAVGARLTALGHDADRMAAKRYLERLVHRGLAERRVDTFPGCYSARIYWPTQLGRAEAQALEDSRIEGV